MTTQQLTEQIQKKQSFLCIGLDVDLNKIPHHLLEEEDPIFAFLCHDTTFRSHIIILQSLPNLVICGNYFINFSWF